MFLFRVRTFACRTIADSCLFLRVVYAETQHEFFPKHSTLTARSKPPVAVMDTELWIERTPCASDRSAT